MENIGLYMHSPVISINHDATLVDFIQKLNDAQVDYLIVKKQDDYIGIVTNTDFMRKALGKRLNPKSTKVSDIMSRPLLTLDISASKAQAQQFFRKNKIEHAPVTEQNQIVGMLLLNDTVKKVINPKLIDPFLETTVLALQGFMTEVTPGDPIEDENLPGEITAIIKLSDHTQNVEITIALNVPEEVSAIIYKNIFGEDPKGIKDICNLIAELSNIIGGNIKEKIGDHHIDIMELIYFENMDPKEAKIHFELDLPTTIVGSGQRIFGEEKANAAKVIIPFFGEKNPMFFLTLIFQEIQ